MIKKIIYIRGLRKLEGLEYILDGNKIKFEENIIRINDIVIIDTYFLGIMVSSKQYDVIRDDNILEI